MRPLKVMQVASHAEIQSGGAIQMFLLARGLHQRGHQVSCVFNRRDERAPLNTLQRVVDEGMELRLFDMGEVEKCAPFRLLPSLLRFRRLVEKGGFDLIHIHREPAFRFVFWATLGLKRAPALIVNRGHSRPVGFLEAMRFRSQRVDRVVAVAQSVKKVMVLTGKIDPCKIEVIYGGVDEERFHPEVKGDRVRRELFPEEPHVPVVGMVANFDSKKSHRYFIEAASIIKEKRKDVRFLIAGRIDRKRLEKTIRLMETFQVKDRFTITDFREDIPEVIAALDVSVNCSARGEGLSGALRESLAMAKPVVATALSGNCELIHHEKTGLLVPPKDAHALAMAILELLEDKDKARRLGQEGRRLIMTQFLHEQRCKKVETLYYDVIEFRRSTLKGQGIKNILYPERDELATNKSNTFSGGGVELRHQKE